MSIKTKLIAHGGFPAKYGENTPESYREAARWNPDAIEMDVIEDPATGQLVCYHPTGESTSGIYTQEEVAAQLAGRDQLPTLRDLLVELPMNMKFVIDIKTPTDSAYEKLFSDPNLPKDRLIVEVRNMEGMKLVKKLDRRVLTLAVFKDPYQYQEFKAEGGDYFRLWEADVTPSLVAAIQSSSLEVWVTPGHKAAPNQPRTAGDVTAEKLAQFVGSVNAVFVNDIELATNYIQTHPQS
jgi:glycerophosphoryl diester phosphodiesterase